MSRVKAFFCGVIVSGFCLGLPLVQGATQKEIEQKAQDQRVKELYQYAFTASFDEKWQEAEEASEKAAFLKNKQEGWKIDAHRIIH